MLVRAVTAGLLLALLTPTVTAADPLAGEWKYEVIYRKLGEPLVGLVLEEGAGAVRIRCVIRKPGKPTVLFTENVPRQEIKAVKRLPDAERKRLAERIDGLQRERERLMDRIRRLDPGKKAPPDADAFALAPIDWPPDPKVGALSYKSTHFHLIGTVRPEVMQLTVIHLEQIYAAYARSLPPRTTRGEPTTVLLTGTLKEYERIAAARGLKLVNPGFYDPAANRVVCGSDLERLCHDLVATRAHHDKLRQDIKQRRAGLRQLYGKKVPPTLLVPLVDAEQRIAASEKHNDATFAAAQRRLFQRLYHEAFHAYLTTFVYPDRDGPLPVWFNEGLAQVFETAIVEVGELRVNHADRERLDAARAALRKSTLLPLADLLRSTPKDFQVLRGDDQQASNRHYLAAWGLAYYLTFGPRRVVGTEEGKKKLEGYVKALRRGTNPLLAFEDLVGEPLPKLEKEFRDYLGKLRPDGTLG